MFEIIKGLTPENKKIIDSVIEQFMMNSLNTRAETFRALNCVAEPNAIVFAGDSITEGYPIYELFPRNLPLYNRGIGGITSKQLLDNLDTHILGLNPKKIFLLIGTNDIQSGDSLNDISVRIQNICEKSIRNCPEANVCVLAVFPLNKTKEKYAYAIGNRDNASICRLNEIIQKRIYDMERVTFINLNSELADQNGDLCEGYTTDGLHLSVAGYQKITKLLLPYIETK